MIAALFYKHQNKEKSTFPTTKIDALRLLSLGTKLSLFCSLMVFQWFSIDQEMISYATLRSFGNQCPKEII